MHEQNNTYFFVANLNVVYKPECSIIKEVRDQVLYLKCQVEAFPPNVTYYWYHNTQLISCKYEFSAVKATLQSQMSVYLSVHVEAKLPFILHPSSFILHPSSFILHPSTFNLQPSSSIHHPSSFISRLLSYSACLI